MGKRRGRKKEEEEEGEEENIGKGRRELRARKVENIKKRFLNKVNEKEEEGEREGRR